MWKRGKGIKSDINHSDIFKLYCDIHREENTDGVSNKEFTKIVKEFNDGLMDLIFKGLVFKVPFNLGFIGIKKSKTKIIFGEDNEVDPSKSTISTDWGTTLKLWKLRPELAHNKFVYHENLHTDGIRYKIAWKKLYIKDRIAKGYKFVPVRWFKRGLARFINNNQHVEYFHKFAAKVTKID